MSNTNNKYNKIELVNFSLDCCSYILLAFCWTLLIMWFLSILITCFYSKFDIVVIYILMIRLLPYSLCCFILASGIIYRKKSVMCIMIIIFILFFIGLKSTINDKSIDIDTILLISIMTIILIIGLFKKYKTN
jgi:hypothetical protein